MREPLDATCGHGSCKDAGTYSMDGYCSNCGREYRLMLTKGHDAPGSWMGARCPNCGCAKVGVCHPSLNQGNGNG
jgi:DNA-directed RNA polymerase subunit RPC12/RpoP